MREFRVWKSRQQTPGWRDVLPCFPTMDAVPRVGQGGEVEPDLGDQSPEHKGIGLGSQRFQ